MAALTAGAIVAVLALAWAGYPLIKDGLVAVFPAAWSDRIGEEMVADESMFEQPCHGTAGIAALDDLAARLSRDAGLPEPITVPMRSGSTSGLPASVQASRAATRATCWERSSLRASTRSRGGSSASVPAK